MAMVKPDNIPEGDFANYFCTYGFVLQGRTAAGWALTLRAAVRRRYLYHQKEMLEDQVRMQAYYDAVFCNKACFEGKARPPQHGRRIPARRLTPAPRTGCAGRGHRQRHPIHLGGAGGRAQGVRRRGEAALRRPLRQLCRAHALHRAPARNLRGSARGARFKSHVGSALGEPRRIRGAAPPGSRRSCSRRSFAASRCRRAVCAARTMRVRSRRAVLCCVLTRRVPHHCLRRRTWRRTHAR